MGRVRADDRQRTAGSVDSSRSGANVRVGDYDGITLADSVLHPVRLAVFCTVVERRSFNRAAEALCVTPSAVSLHVRALEALWQTSLVIKLPMVVDLAVRRTTQLVASS
jgi:hypothetical protein